MKKALSLLVIVALVAVLVGALHAEASHEHYVPSNGNGGPGFFSLALGTLAGITTAIFTGSNLAGAAAGVAGLAMGRGIEGYAASAAAARGVTHCDTHVRNSMGRQVIHDEDCISTVTRPGYMGTVGHAPVPPTVTYAPPAVQMNPYPDARPAPASPAPQAVPLVPQPAPPTAPVPQAVPQPAAVPVAITVVATEGPCGHLYGQAYQACRERLIRGGEPQS